MEKHIEALKHLYKLEISSLENFTSLSHRRKLSQLEEIQEKNTRLSATALQAGIDALERLDELICPHGVKHYEHYCRECSRTILEEEWSFKEGGMR